MTTVFQSYAHNRQNFFWLALPGCEPVSPTKTLLGIHLPAGVPREDFATPDSAREIKIWFNETGELEMSPPELEPWWKGEPAPYWLHQLD